MENKLLLLFLISKMFLFDDLQMFIVNSFVNEIIIRSIFNFFKKGFTVLLSMGLSPH